MTLMHKPNEHAMLIQRGKLFLLFCKKSAKYQNIGVFKFYCRTYSLYMYAESPQVQQTLEAFLKITYTF